MKCIDRLEKYKDEDLDTILLKIKNGTIKCGRYAHLIKIDKNDNKPIDRKEIFINGKRNKSK